MASAPRSAVATSPMFVPADSLHSLLTHETLIEHFRSSLPTVTPSISTPIRQSYAVSPDASLLLMPSWSSHPSLPYIGVKLVTYFPDNSHRDLPGIHANYVLFSSATGQTLATMDGTVLTLYRTSSVSGLASSILSRNDSEVMVMVGAGALAPHLIQAHLAARPRLKRVIIWNRRIDKAISLAEKMRGEGRFEGVSFESGGYLEEIVPLADIVSCATNAEEPLVMGRWLKPGAHLDLVGSFKPTMRECDDEAVRRAADMGCLFVDNRVAMEEAGELAGAVERGVIGEEEIVGDLVELVKGEKVGRRSPEEITVFKSVGSGVVDILTAQLVYDMGLKHVPQPCS
ncbi:protein SAR DEFICIENT 4 [Punica granatum]|uniref:Uncharacterized protein n=2 Tax=Punica granatum TaxID=22663 RepID=A0A218WSV4_PUNGR|nr:protein SAR DEFICIENT 4 [Punica granatum]OWM75589.1 hypothetical protein CDL15_Pgr021753 [Punica granatum]PKI52094.1 hypothetical protein CRG98_027510 [Punica granatum]